MFQSTSVIGLVWLVSWDLHHNSASTDDVFSYSLVLALVLCRSEGSIGFQCTSVKRSVASHEAVLDDLGCAGYSSSTDYLSQHTQQVSLHACIGVKKI